MKQLRQGIQWALILGSTALFIGCAAPARIEEMAIQNPSRTSSPTALHGSLGSVEVTGGSETNPLWASKVSSAAFQRALENSLKAAGLYSPSGVSGNYQLTADLLSLDQPVLGIDMTVGANVRYSLTERTTRKEVFSKVLQTSYTAKFSDAFAGTQRLQLANEGSIRANIAALIEELVRFNP